MFQYLQEFDFCQFQNASATKEIADNTFKTVTDLDKEVDDMLKQLTEAEKELNKKQQSADQDMMMAGMVSNYDCFKKTHLVV